VDLHQRAAAHQRTELGLVGDDLPARQQQGPVGVAHAEGERLAEDDAVLDR
jgi:hypothetical protein